MAVTTAAIITVMGPVGSDIRVGVPPNSAAKNPIIMAPYKPASGPAPEAKPNARAKGKDTIAAVKPPKISPFKLFLLMVLKIFKECPFLYTMFDF
jgi:hypothetical protein